jgi:benzoyl-CoA-dihydrodiol lyase
MLAASPHAWKVNFCKFTNETRNAMEEASASSGQRYLAAINGTASGGGYELALACDHLVLIDDNSSAVSLPEVPLLGVLPGTGGLTRVVDKRHVRRDLADVVATRAEGIRGRTALEWGLVDELAPRSRLAEVVASRAAAMAASSDRPASGPGVTLSPLDRQIDGDRIAYRYVTATLDGQRRLVDITITGPPSSDGQPTTGDQWLAAGDASWALATVRELDDLILHLRTNQLDLGTWVLRTEGDADAVAAVDQALAANQDHWLVREIVLYWRRTLKRLDMTSRSLIAIIEPGSCFTGTLLELGLAADRSYLLDGGDPPPTIRLTEMNFGAYPMANGLTRLATRFLGEPAAVDTVRTVVGKSLTAGDAAKFGLVTFTPDDIDWDDEVRLALEERGGFSPDALTGMEANLRFPGPETMETKIFGRLTAWQNWIFQRPNATGPEGALHAYGTGHRPDFDRKRV